MASTERWLATLDHAITSSLRTAARILSRPRPTAEDLVVLYIPEESEWRASCSNMLASGFKQVASFNPYWDAHGRTFEDPDGYRTVLQRDEWRSAVAV